MSIKVILFDMDGTLVNTNRLISESFKYTLNQYGYQFTDKEISAFNGPPLVDTFKKLDDTLADEMIQTYRTHNLAHHEQYISTFPEVKETLQVLAKENIPMGVVSTKMRDGVDLALSITGLTDFFQKIVTIDDVEQAKPHPESVVKCLSALNGDPETALMVGDNYHDILAGKNAGTKTAGVAWSEKGAAYLEQFKPTYMLESMKDILKIVEV